MTSIFISSCDLPLLTLHKLQGMYTGNHTGLGTKLIFLFHMNQNGAMSRYHNFRMSACQKRLDSTHNRVITYHVGISSLFFL